MEQYNPGHDDGSQKINSHDSELEKRHRKNIESLKKESKKNTVIFSSCFSALFLVVGILGGFIIGKSYADRLHNDTYSPEVIKFNQCYNIIKENWLYGKTEADVKQVMTELFTTGQSSVDHYTFLTADEESQNLGIDNEGYGYQIIYCPQGVLMEKVFLNGAMYKAGGRDNDIITAITINGVEKTLQGRTFAEIQEILQASREATSSSFTVFRGSETLHFNNVKKSKYTQDTAWKVEDMSDDKTLTVRIDSFLGNPQVSDANEIIESAGENIDTLVIDLRDNGGGYVGQMANLAGLFAPKGNYIMQAKDRDGNVVSYAKQNSNPRFSDLKIKVLQNGMSASASESLTLSLKQNNAAEIYGFQSYGKGIAQSLYEFDDGSVLRYTTMQMYAPDGETCIHEVGITPDYKSDEAENYNFTEYPASFSSYALTGKNYTSYLPILADFVEYLGYPVAGDVDEGKLMTKINEFQEAYDYDISASYDDEVSKQLIYEIYEKKSAQDREELSWVTGIASQK